jgi:hypothetical protein
MTMPAVMVTGKGRAAIVSAAAARSSAGKASRRANACSRSDAFDESISAVFAIAK